MKKKNNIRLNEKFDRLKASQEEDLKKMQQKLERENRRKIFEKLQQLEAVLK